MKKILYTIALCATLLHVTRAQDAKEKFMLAEYYFMNEDYPKALPLYVQCYVKDTANFNLAYRIGLCYKNMPLKIFQSIPYLEKASRGTTIKYKEGSFREKKANVDALFHLGYVYQMVRRFDDAIASFEKFRSLADVRELYAIDETDRRIESCKRGKEMLKKTRWAEIENIGNIVNSIYADLNPCVSANDTVLIFTRIINRVKDENEAFINKYKILQSTREGKVWGKPTDITGDLGSDGSYTSISLSPDGKTLILYKDEFEDGSLTNVDHGSLYISRFENGSWKPLKKIGGPVNTVHEENAAWISNDGNTIIFSSNRPGTYGGMDMWKATRKDNSWSEAENLGQEINSPYDDDYPYLVNDTLLYFCSDGHDNIGGMDVYYSKFINNRVWSTPVNMSYPVNSPADDIMFVPTKHGKVAYYAVERHEGYLSFGKSDIYRILLDPRADNDFIPIDSALASATYKPVPMVGVLKLGDNSVLTPAIHITVMDPKTNKLLYQTTPNYETGEFKLDLIPGEYTVQIEGDHYNRTTQNLYIAPDGNTNVRFDVKLEHKQVSSGEYLKIKALFFDFGRDSLTRESQIELERILSLMNANPSLYIEVVGYTDSKGSTQFNKALSIKRSKRVVDYLISKGIDASRFVSKGMGEEDQVAINENADGTDNPEGRQLNRRVEMRVLKSDNQLIITENITVPDNLKYKGQIRYSIAILKDTKVYDDTYFEPFYAKGLTKVLSLKDGDQYLYYTGDFKDKASAVASLNAFIEMGFEKAEILDYFKLNRMTDITVTKVNTKSSGIFVIQLRAQQKSCDISKTFPSLQDKVKQHQGTDGYFRYYYGAFNRLLDARAECNKMRDAGYTDAFVVDMNKFQTSSMKPTTSATYTIQVFAASKKISIETFKNIGTVEEKIGQDGMYRYIYGTYSSWNEAQLAIHNVKAKGFEGAFISNINRY